MGNEKKDLLAIGPKWMGRYPMVDADHEDILETNAAVNEFGKKMPRHEAEAQAHEDYRKDQLHEAAAHHLVGMRAATAAGDSDASEKHGAMYQLALKALGHDSTIDPPPEVAAKARHTPATVYRFKAHKGDAFAMTDEKKPEADEKS